MSDHPPIWRILLGVAGAAVVARSMFEPLTGRGPASAMATHDTADLLLRGTVDAWAPRWVGLLLYVPVVLAGIGLVLLGLRTATGVAAVVAGLNVAVVVVAGFAIGRGPLVRPGPGYVGILIGTMIMSVASVTRRNTRPDADVAAG